MTHSCHRGRAPFAGPRSDLELEPRQIAQSIDPGGYWARLGYSSCSLVLTVPQLDGVSAFHASFNNSRRDTGKGHRFLNGWQAKDPADPQRNRSQITVRYK
jgi:hypothetical protein